MTKRLLIDASHAEETRVVVLDGNRLEDFDVETAARRQIKGNIYLAKIIRVEPSLQAAFVEYGGNRHGFLAFGEIHPDYYQTPVADRQRLLAQQAREEAEYAASQEAEENGPLAPDEPAEPARAQPLDITAIEISSAPPPESTDEEFTGGPLIVTDAQAPGEPAADAAPAAAYAPDEPAQTDAEYNAAADPGDEDAPASEAAEATDEATVPEVVQADTAGAYYAPNPNTEALEEHSDAEPEAPPPESLGGDGDDAAEAREKRQRQRFLRNYKIQEVIHRRQIMLIQVVKEERGNKGAALTTYLSLAGRFSVLMPNSPTGGGVSRKITSVSDRRRLKEAMAELDVPDGMGLIVRTAGANRPKPEIKRDCEYLLRLWDDIRDKTMQSVAPALINEEASLIKRTIRDVYTRDVEEVMVDGEDGYAAAHDFMRMLMPSNAAKVKLWSEGQPLFAHYQVENQLDAMLNPTVQLRSGGYIVINQTEALVAIDVNSGRSTRERSIEDTALRTNLEAADEAARQLRMRDLAGLIVIDFIDMESRRNNAAVERRLKDALKNDRARIQIGTISHFGLMEMSRQRLRPSLAEASLMTCPHCAGMGQIRSPESAALHVLRAIEDEGAKSRAAEIAVFLPPETALYLFNHKRDRLGAIETRYAMRVMFSGDTTLTAATFRIEKVRARDADAPAAPPPPPRARPEPLAAPVVDEEVAEITEDEAAPVVQPGETGEDADRKRRRRRRRGKRRPDGTEMPAGEDQPADAELTDGAAPPAIVDPAAGDNEASAFDLVLAAELGEPEDGDTTAAEAPARRRRSRGGRRRGGSASVGGSDETPSAAAMPAPLPAPVYLDIADIFEAAEQAEANARHGRVILDKASDGAPADYVAEEEATPDAAVPQDPAADEIETIGPSLAEAGPSGPGQALEPVAAADETSASAPAKLPESVPEPVEVAAGQVVATPAFGPRVIGVDAPAAGEKKGWWRR